ncbi:MAG: hypothetical protein E6X86_04595 [Clostridium butyricum]|nr:hypothetical protein [Clostridium butyricum]MDU4853565.1 hypothetical protein [Clostridioides difficile]
MQQRLQRVFNNEIAGKLLAEGFKIHDIQSNRNNPNVNVFRFYKTDNLSNRLEELRKPYKRATN